MAKRRAISSYSNKKNTSLENIVEHVQTARTEKVGVNDGAKVQQNVEKSYDNGKKVYEESKNLYRKGIVENLDWHKKSFQPQNPQDLTTSIASMTGNAAKVQKNLEQLADSVKKNEIKKSATQLDDFLEENSTFAETKFRKKNIPTDISLDSNGYELNSREREVLCEDIMRQVHQFGRSKTTSYAYTSDNFCVFENLGGEQYKLLSVVPIVRNENVIGKFENIINDGNNADREALGRMLKEVQHREGMYYWHNANAEQLGGATVVLDKLNSSVVERTQRNLSRRADNTQLADDNDRRTQSETQDAELTRFRKGRYGKNSSERLQGEWNAEKQAMLDEFGLNEVRLPAEEFGRFATAIERWADSNPTRFGETEIMSIPVYNDETEQWDACTFVYQSSYRYAITDIEYGTNEKEYYRNGDEVYAEYDRLPESDNTTERAGGVLSDGVNQERLGLAGGVDGVDRQLLSDDKNSSIVKGGESKDNELEIPESETPNTAVRFRTAARNGELTPLWSQVFSSLLQETSDQHYYLHEITKQIEQALGRKLGTTPTNGRVSALLFFCKKHFPTFV